MGSGTTAAALGRGAIDYDTGSSGENQIHDSWQKGTALWSKTMGRPRSCLQPPVARVQALRGSERQVPVLLEGPARDGFGEIFSVLVLPEDRLGLDAEDAAIRAFEQGAHVAAVLAVVDLDKLLPDGSVRDFSHDAFEDYGFVGFFRGDDATGIGRNVPRFAGAKAGAEPEGVLPPDTPDEHEMGACVGARGSNPIIVRFF